MIKPIFFDFFIITTIFLLDVSLGVRATSLTTDSCDDCIQRARTSYSRTVSDPEQFCVDNNLCVRIVKTPGENTIASENEIPEIESEPSSLAAFDPTEMPTMLFFEASFGSDNKEIESVKEATEMPTMLFFEASFGSDNKEIESVKEATVIPTLSPTMLPTSNAPNTKPTPPNSVQAEPRNNNSSLPIDAPSSELTFHESIPKTDVNQDSMTTSNTRKATMSSIFLKNLTTAMDEEVSEIFSLVALDFLRDYSIPIDLSEGIDFVVVNVMQQGPELGNSTEFDVHIDGMHVFFETIVTVEGDKAIDIPRLIEKIFKHHKTDFFFRLAEAHEFFIPLYGESRSQNTSTSDFMSSWVISCIVIVVCSVMITAVLLARMLQRTRPRRELSKQDSYPLKVKQTESDGSSQTNNMRDGNRESGAVEILKNLESGESVADSLVGLKLLQSQDNASVAKSWTSFKKKKYGSKRLNDRTNIVAKKERKESSKPGHKARMRKRQIERDLQDFQNRRSGSGEGTSMGAILIATSSLNSGEDDDQPKQTIEIVQEQRDDISTEGLQKRSIMGQLTTIFRPKIKKQKTDRLEPVQKLEEGGSEQSFFGTPSPNNKLKLLSVQTSERDRTDRNDRLSTDTDILLKSIPRENIIPVESEIAVSPNSPMYSHFSRKESRYHLNPDKPHFISSPKTKIMQGSRTATQPAGHYYS